MKIKVSLDRVYEFTDSKIRKVNRWEEIVPMENDSNEVEWRLEI